jgi:hypothetical protein
LRSAPPASMAVTLAKPYWVNGDLIAATRQHWHRLTTAGRDQHADARTGRQHDVPTSWPGTSSRFRVPEPTLVAVNHALTSVCAWRLPDGGPNIFAPANRGARRSTVREATIWVMIVSCVHLSAAGPGERSRPQRGMSGRASLPATRRARTSEAVPTRLSAFGDRPSRFSIGWDLDCGPSLDKNDGMRARS